jgi:hypothetical protein
MTKARTITVRAVRAFIRTENNAFSCLFIGLTPFQGILSREYFPDNLPGVFPAQIKPQV